MDESGKQVEVYSGEIVLTYDKKLDKLKELWNEVFDDQEQFVDYYHDNVCEYNKIISAYSGEKLVGMVHLNPYRVVINDKEVNAYYVVGVAVTRDMRQRGIMRLMMNTAKEDAKKEGVSLLFLMPALEAYYNNLGYKKIYDTKCMDFSVLDYESFERGVSDCYASLKLSMDFVLEMEEDKIDYIAEVINEKLGLKYSTYCKRDRAYLLSMAREHRCQAGDLCIVGEHKLSEPDEKHNYKDMVGVFAYGIYDDTMYVERFEAFEDSFMALLISVFKLAAEVSCSRCIITVPSCDVDSYEQIIDGIELNVHDDKGIMACGIDKKTEEYMDVYKGNVFIDEIV